MAYADQIAQFTEISQGQDFSLINGASTETLSGSSQINFAFNPALGTMFGGSQRPATLTWTGTSTTAASIVGGDVNESGFSGTFSIIDNALSTNLLSGTFGPTGVFDGSGASATFSDAAPPPTEVTFSSAYVDFSITTNRAFGLSFSSFSNSPLSIAGDGRPIAGTYAGTGTFSASPLPGTPEPMTLVLVGSALAALGLARRRRRS